VGLSSTWLVVRYLLAVNAARQNVRDRLAASGVVVTASEPAPPASNG
jgi:hypothetical protein